MMRALTPLILWVLASPTVCHGRLQWPYRDSELPIEDRLDDLLSRMSLEEKAGQMYHGRALPSESGQRSTKDMIENKFMTHFVYSGGISNVSAFIEWHNEMQDLALETRLGIPITFSTDPQHGWTQDGATSNIGLSFSRWPEPMGLAAIRDPDLSRDYADVVRQELSAVGLRQVLYPQVDLATEPRWGRTGLTLGEDANLTTEVMLSLLDGFRGEDAARSVIATVKHFPGAGPMENGTDAHFPWGKNTIYHTNSLGMHLQPFKAAIEAGAPQIMPYYSRPKGLDWEPTGFAFNKPVITGLLREEMGFDGIILTDFGILTITPWGVEHLSELDRTYLALEAGCDIIGGESSTQHTIKLVENGRTSESRIDASVRRLLRQKFELGLFDHPRVDKQAAAKIVGNNEFRQRGLKAQMKAFTLLTNKNDVLPLPPSMRNATVYAEGIPEEVLVKRGFTVVRSTEEADFAILRLASAFDPPDPNWPASAAINNGSLAFTEQEKSRQAAIYDSVPTIVDIKCNRPPVVPEVADKAVALLASYGSSDDALLDIIFGIRGAQPRGKLPFDMPSSMVAVERSLEDVAFDTLDPVFRFGHGLSYKRKTCTRRP